MRLLSLGSQNDSEKAGCFLCSFSLLLRTNLRGFSVLTQGMRRSSPAYYSPPRRGYGGRGGGSGRRGYGGGRRRENNNGSLLVRNIPLDCRPDELRAPFERFGPVRDVYIPKDYYSGEPRGFAFVQFVDPYEASEAQYHMNRQIFAGREITVVVAEETRKRPEEMRHRTRPRGPVGYGGRRSSYYGRSRSRSITRSRSPPYPSGSRNRYRSRQSTEACNRGLNLIFTRSYSPAPRRQSDYSVSPRRQAEHPRSPRGPPVERDADQKRRSYSPAYGNGVEQNQSNGYADLRLIEASGSHPEVEHRDHPSDLDQDQDLLICHPDVEDEVAGRWQCAAGLLYISCNLSRYLLKICVLLEVCEYDGSLMNK
ncbi:Serine/arginine-rich SC35-like splicing factor SCL30, partial [Mucuna pruriens]